MEPLPLQPLDGVVVALAVVLSAHPSQEALRGESKSEASPRTPNSNWESWGWRGMGWGEERKDGQCSQEDICPDGIRPVVAFHLRDAFSTLPTTMFSLKCLAVASLLPNNSSGRLISACGPLQFLPLSHGSYRPFGVPGPSRPLFSLYSSRFVCASLAINWLTKTSKVFSPVSPLSSRFPEPPPPAATTH